MPSLPDDVTAAVTRALAEDVGTGDVTAELVAEGTRATATVVAREAAVLCGSAWFDEVFRQLDQDVAVSWHCRDGDALEADQAVCTLDGPARPILTGERTALNFLQTLSGTATVARRYAEAVAGTDCVVLDTRKTLPGLRSAQKYAVACGGAANHRHGLFDAILVKENHIAACGNITAAVRRARSTAPHLPLEVEVETLDETREAMTAGADIILLDNFGAEDLAAAVAMNKELTGGRTKLEASGNITLDKLRDLASIGVDRVSIGALTKHVRATDLSLRLRFRPPGEDA